MGRRCNAPQEIQEGDLLAYIEGDASPVVIRHIAQCAACAREVEFLREVDGLFSAAFQYAPAGVSTGAKVGVRPQSRQWAGKWWLWPDAGQLAWGGAALTLAAILVVLGVVFSVGRAGWGVSEQAGGFLAATLEVSEEVAGMLNTDLETGQAKAETSSKPSQSSAITGGIAETPAAIAPPRDLLLMLKDEWAGLIEDSLAIAPPRDLLVMLDGEMENHPDYDFVRSLARGEAFWYKTVVTNQQNGVSYFLWVEDNDRFSAIYAARSDDGGQTLSTAISLNQGTDHAFNPILAVDSAGNLYAMWRTRQYLAVDIFFARSVDGGQSWSKSVRINDDIRQAFNPSLAIDKQGRVYVAWQNYPGTVATDIYLSHSSDGGRTWSKERRMAN